MDNNAVENYNSDYRYYSGTDGYPLNYNRALECFLKAAEAGVSDAMNYLGIMYKNGNGVMKNSRTAADWYYRALKADPKNAYAAHNLGVMYYNGEGVPRDIGKAFGFFKSSARLGLGNKTAVYPDSCYMTGLILRQYNQGTMLF